MGQPIQGQFFLSRNGEVFGPFNQAQIDQLKSSGQIFQYFWIWDGSTSSWGAIHPPPPVPKAPAMAAPVPEEDDIPAQSEPVASPPPQVRAATAAPTLSPAIAAPTPAREIKWSGTLQAICHDYKEIVGGKIGSPSHQGCILISDESPQHAELPSFRKGRKIWLNLLDESSGRSENIPGVVEDLSHRDGKWQYRIRWSESPKIFG